MPDSSFIIRQPQKEDAKNIIEFLNTVAGESDFLTFGKNGFFLDEQEEEDIIHKCLIGYSSFMLVCIHENHVVAQSFIDQRCSPRTKHIADISLSVSNKFYRNGIATKMINDSISWCIDNKISKIELCVRVDNYAAISMYEKLGFTREATIKHAIKIEEKYFDNYIYSFFI